MVEEEADAVVAVAAVITVADTGAEAAVEVTVAEEEDVIGGESEPIARFDLFYITCPGLSLP